MGNRNLNDLVPQMQHRAELFKAKCEALGVPVLIYNTTRTLEEQAKLYRQGRSYIQIKNKMHSLRKRGFGFLADIIDKVGPQKGDKIVTNAGPGESFHNFAEAFDAVPMADIDGDNDLECLWNSAKYEYEWSILFATAIELKLEAGGLWKGFVDSPHFQLRKGSNPTRIYSPEKLKSILIENGLLSE